MSKLTYLLVTLKIVSIIPSFQSGDTTLKTVADTFWNVFNFKSKSKSNPISYSTIMVLDGMDMYYQDDAGTAIIPYPLLRCSSFNHSLYSSEILIYYLGDYSLVVGTATIPSPLLQYTKFIICLIKSLCDWIMVSVWRWFVFGVKD